jgi:hypothetical protein
MAKSQIKYRDGYKYQLAEDFSVATNIKPKADIATQFIDLNKQGTLVVKSGYAWDGPSGPVADTKETMRASLVHDAFYQLMRRRKISTKTYRNKADRLFQKMCKQDGVPSKIALAYYWGLKLGGKPSADPKNAKVVRTAP